MFRAAISKGTPIGMKAKSYMDQGALVPDDVVIGVIAERLRQSDCAPGFILDGFPRTIPQAEALQKLLSEMGRNIGAVVAFDVEDDALVSRLTGRRTCKDCGAMYHVVNMRPKKEGICDHCGKQNIVQRDDDREEVIKSRLKVYHDQTKPLINFYTVLGVLKHIDAASSPDQVEQSLQSIMNAAKI